jgi:hypothetical protein
MERDCIYQVVRQLFISTENLPESTKKTEFCIKPANSFCDIFDHYKPKIPESK